MEIYSIEIKSYKRIYNATIFCCFLLMVSAWLLVKNGLFFSHFYGKGKQLFWPIFIITMVISQLFSKKQRTELERLNEMTDFDQKVEHYQKIYRLRLLFYGSIILSQLILFVLTATYYYFYFNLINVFMILIAFPNLKLFKMELKNDEIFFI